VSPWGGGYAQNGLVKGHKLSGSNRLFVAVDPPQEVCEQLAAWAKVAVRGLGLRKGASPPVRVLDPGLLHVTLCFLGERPLAEIAAIEDVLAACAAPAGELRTGAPVWLPPRRPRTLGVEVRDSENCDPAESLLTLHESLLQALARVCGLEAERRRFRAHVTLARMKDDRGRGYGIERSSLPATPVLSFTPQALVLYRSWLSPAGASYEALASHALTPL
jgi:2'-5' RNA ligase